MKKLLKYMKGNRARAALAPVFKMLEAASELFVPLVMADIIDVGIANGDRSYILGKCGILVIIALLGFSFTVLAQFFSAKAAVGFTSNIKKALFRKIISFEYADIDREGTASLLAKMTGDMNEVQNGVNLTLRLFMRSPFIVFGAAIMAFTVDSPSAVIFVVLIPILAAVVFALLLASIPLFRKVRKKTEELLAVVREHLFGVRVIRAFGIDGKEQKRFDKENGELTKRSRFAGKISALMNPATYVIVNLGIIVLLYTGAIRIDSGKLTVGELVALYNYMSQILVELLKLANLMITISRSLSAAGRIEEVLDAGGKDASGTLPVPEEYDVALSVKDLTFSYDEKSHPALSGVSFELRRGETLGVIGPTGSGKTTLINLVSGFYKPTTGSVEIFENDIGEYDKDSLRRAVRRVPQRSALFSGTVRENLLLAGDYDDKDLLEAASFAMAKDFLLEKNGLDTEIGEDGAGLSGGQRQRLTIARALVGRPKFIILDDCASSLDPATAKALRRSVSSLPQNPTVIIAAQRTTSVMGADKIVVLDDGVCVGAGTHEELLKNCPVYREIHASRYGKDLAEGGSVGGKEAT